MIDEIKLAVGHAWDLLFSPAKDAWAGGVVVRFFAFLQDNPVLLLPLGFYLIVLGIKTARRMITGV